MANPTLPSTNIMFDRDNLYMEMDGVIVNDKVVVGTQKALVADAAASTAVPIVMTWTANEPTAADAQTIADGTVPTVAELGQFVRNMEDFMEEVLVDLNLHRTAINAALDVLEAHGLMADA